MSSNPAKFTFPVDDALWVVKHIDQFTQAHARTRTAAVKVMLQRLPLKSTSQLARLSTTAARELLGKRDTDAKPVFDFVSILVGALPGICIGDVFRNGEKVGELPSVKRTFTLNAGETDSTEAKAGGTIEPLPGWGTMPCRVLNASEYSGIADHPLQNVRFSQSRFAYFRRTRKDGGTDTFVLPRMTIFKAFYAQHSVLANAFCAGPWEHEVHRAISFTRTMAARRPA